MSLSDLMSGARLSTYPEIALGLFVLVFVAVAVRLALQSEREAWARAGDLPLQPDVPDHDRSETPDHAGRREEI